MLLEEAVEKYMEKLSQELVDSGFNYDGSVVSDGITTAFREMTVNQIKDFIAEVSIWEDVPVELTSALATSLTARNSELIAFMFNFCPAWVNYWFKNEIDFIGEYFDELQ